MMRPAGVARGALREQGSHTNSLRKIANTIEQWNILAKDTAAPSSIATPNAAMRYSTSTIWDAEEREAVDAALPVHRHVGLRRHRPTDS
jgi:hypothetical protein